MTEKSIKFNDNLPDLHQEKLAELKKLLPNLFDKDGNLIKSELENFVGNYKSDTQGPFCFTWAGKQKAKGLAFKQSETKLALKFNEERSKNFKTTQNLIIEGDNLHVLKLLVPSYKNKVKCIYIDPPYNTQNEFIYPDNYATSEIDYLLESGQIEEGQDVSGQNIKEKNTGRKHSNWLSFMYPRLVLARELLCEDGVIFVSIDDNEVHHLKHMMNEIFGEEEFVANIIWQDKYTTTNDKNGISSQTEYILCFAKDLEKININKLPLREDYIKSTYTYDDNDDNGKYRLVQMYKKKNPHSYEVISPTGKVWNLPWNFTKENFKQMDRENKIFWGKDGNAQPQKKVYLRDTTGINPVSLLLGKDAGFSGDGGDLIENILGNRNFFSYPKPVSLIKHLLQISTAPNDLILDFFAGSGTTAQAVMELNQDELNKKAKDGIFENKQAVAGGRRFILVQLPEKIDAKKEAFKAGYKHISDITIERVKRASQKYQNVDNGFKVLELTESAIDRKLMNKSIATKEEIFAEIACAFGYGLNYTYREQHNLGKGITYLQGNNREALVILGEKQIDNQTLADIVLNSDAFKQCQIFAQDECLNVEIIYNLYQHFEQKRVIIL